MGGIGIRITEDFHPEQKETWDVDGETVYMNRRTIETLMDTDPSAVLALMPSKEEIASKSRADGVTKTIICMQAMWYIAQCLTRGKCPAP